MAQYLKCPRGCPEDRLVRFTSGASASRWVHTGSGSSCSVGCLACGRRWDTRSAKAWHLSRMSSDDFESQKGTDNRLARLDGGPRT